MECVKEREELGERLAQRLCGQGYRLGVWISPIMPIRNPAKKLITWLAIGCVAPLGLSEILARSIWKRDVWFTAHGDLLSLIPGKIGRYLRNAYYWMTLEKCPLDCCFTFGMSFTHSEASVGHHVYIGTHSKVGMVSIGDDTLLGDHVHILSGKRQHSFEDPERLIREQPQMFCRINIGSNSWLGTNCVAMADIGKNCVIGAGSVVTESVPDQFIAAGNPARILRPMRKPYSPEIVLPEAMEARRNRAEA